jgi:hypothetical protein
MTYLLLINLRGLHQSGSHTRCIHFTCMIIFNPDSFPQAEVDAAPDQEFINNRRVEIRGKNCLLVLTREQARYGDLLVDAEPGQENICPVIQRIVSRFYSTSGANSPAGVLLLCKRRHDDDK